MARLKRKPPAAIGKLNEARKRKRDAEQEQLQQATPAAQQQNSRSYQAEPESSQPAPSQTTARHTRAKAAKKPTEQVKTRATRALRGKRGAASAPNDSTDNLGEVQKNRPVARGRRRKQAAQQPTKISQPTKKAEPTRKSTRGRKRAQPEDEVESSRENTSNKESRLDTSHDFHDDRLNEARDAVSSPAEARSRAAREERDPSDVEPEGEQDREPSECEPEDEQNQERLISGNESPVENGDQSAQLGAPQLSSEVVEESSNGAEHQPEEHSEHEPQDQPEHEQSPESPVPRTDAPFENENPDTQVEGSREESEEVEGGENEGEVELDENGEPRRKRRKKNRKRRGATPEGAEDVEIDPDSAMMFDLTSDMKQGKMSGLEASFREINWAEVARKKREEQDQALQTLLEGNQSTENRDTQEPEHSRSQSTEPPPQQNQGPQLKLVNGQMVIDEDSLVNQQAELPNTDEGVSVVEENDLTKRVNARSWVAQKKRDPVERIRMSRKSKAWNEESTDEFYKGLRMWGTDFMIIAQMFPGRTRAHIKAKFTREERLNPERVEAALTEEIEPMNIEKYAEATGMEPDYYKDPDEFKEELRLAEQEKREEIARFRKEQEDAMQERQEAARVKADAKAARKDEARKNREARKKGKKSREKRGAVGGQRLSTVDGESVYEEWSEEEDLNEDSGYGGENDVDGEEQIEDGEDVASRASGEEVVEGDGEDVGVGMDGAEAATAET